MAGSVNKVGRALGNYRLTITDGHNATPLSGRVLWHFACQVSVVETGLVECAEAGALQALAAKLDKTQAGSAWARAREIAKATKLLPKPTRH